MVKSGRGSRDFETHPVGTGERLKALEAEVARLRGLRPHTCCIDEVIRGQARTDPPRAVDLGGGR